MIAVLIATTGDVMRLWVPGRTIIVLSSDEAATDLLHKRSTKYSSRPDFAMMTEYVAFFSQFDEGVVTR
jgi:hypothetical protein